MFSGKLSHFGRNPRQFLNLLVCRGKSQDKHSGCESKHLRCWSENPSIRPSMTKIHFELARMFKYMKGADKPILFVNKQGTAKTEDSSISTFTPKNAAKSSEFKTILPQMLEQVQRSRCTNIAPDKFLRVESIGEKISKDVKKRRSADLSSSDIKLPSDLGRPRSGSCDFSQLKAPEVSNNFLKYIDSGPNVSLENVEGAEKNVSVGEFNMSYSGNYFCLLEPQFQPVPPVECSDSIEIYDKHMNLARELFRYKNEATLLNDRKNELEDQLSKYFQLKKENESLQKLRQSLKRQIEIIQTKQPQSDDWVIVG